MASKILLLLVTVSTIIADATTVVPDFAGMIYPSSSVSQHVQFGDPSSSFPTAYEFVAPTTESVTCVDVHLCLELQISSVFDMNPFFLHRYDTNTPLVSATFDGYDAKDILPLIPSSTDGEPTVWWFQSNATNPSTGSATGTSTISGPPAIDMLLRLRQRSQRLSARDQLLVQMHFEVVDSRTVTSEIQVYSVYGSQLVTHTTRRVDANTIRVALSITRDSEKRDVNSSDVYPLAATTLSDTTSGASASEASCDACGDLLDACEDIESCQSVVLPCLISQLEAMAVSSGQSTNNEGSGSGLGGDGQNSNGDTGSRSSGSDVAEHYITERVDLIGPLAVCAATLPTTSWLPIRQALFCLARLKCPLGLVPGEHPGERYPTILRMSTNGSQTFVVTPTISGTNNVNLTIVMRDIRSSVNDQQAFAYSASATYLGMFLRSFVLQQAAEVSVLVESDANDLSTLQISLNYSNALMLKSLAFNTTAGQVPMIKDVPAQAVIEYPASSSGPVLDIILGELRERVSDSFSASPWILAADCLSCSMQLFGCSSDAVSNNLCSYRTMASSFGMCIRDQLPPKVYKGIMQGTASRKTVAAEISRCVSAASYATNELDSILKASSSLACFASTRCPFGPIALVQDARAIILETTSYVQLLRISPSSSTGAVSIQIEYKTGEFLVGTTSPIYIVSTENEIEEIISNALASTGAEVFVRSSDGKNSRTEWILEIIYRYVFLAGKFSANAKVNGHSLGSGAMKQVLMEGDDAQLRAVPRNRTKVFKQSEVEPTSPTYALPPNDKCRKCALVTTRCQSDPVCSLFSRETLVPSLRAADVTQTKTSLNANGQETFEFDLVPTLQSAVADGFSDWNLLAAELYCFAEVQCDMEYTDIQDTTSGSHLPTYLSLGKFLTELHVRTYIDTQWTMTILERNFIYQPSQASATTIILAAEGFLNWMKTKMSYVVPNINVQHSGSWTEEDTGAAVGIITLYGQYDEFISRYLMANLTTVPSFSASSPEGIPPAGVNVTHWNLSLTSVGHAPQYSKLLDLLRFGVDASDSTTTPSTKYIAPTDECRACEAATLRCQNDTECVQFSREKVVPLLRAGNGEFDVSLWDDQGRARIAFPFGPKLYSLTSSAFISLESWDVLAAELSCFAKSQCDLEYDDILEPTIKVHSPTYLSIDRQGITLCVHTYTNTEWSMEISGSVLTYVPNASTSNSSYDAAIALRDWIEEKTTQDPYNFNFAGGEPTVEAMDGIATFNVTLDGPWSTLGSNNLLLTASLVPKLKATGGTGANIIQVDVVPWGLSFYSVNYKPQYSKLIDLLESGFVEESSTQSPSASPSATSDGSANSDGYECVDCIKRLKNCRQDTTCASALTSLTTQLQDSMESEQYTYDATELMLDSIFPAIATADGRQKMLSLIACSSSLCIQKSCDIVEPGKLATLKVIPATCTFTVNTGLTINIQLHGQVYSYAEIDDAAAFALFVENEVLGGYKSSCIQVKATKESVLTDKVIYTFILNGSVAAAPPHFYPGDGTAFEDSTESPAKFLFTASTQKLLDVYQPWISWLISADTSSVPADSTTDPTLLEMLPKGDACRKCAGEIQRCLDDTECAEYSHNVLLPWLRDAAQSNENVEVDLTPVLTAFTSSSREAWHALSAELVCLALTNCETGYYGVNTDGVYHPSTLSIDPMAVNLFVCTYADTQWNVSINGETSSYTPTTDALEFSEALPAFQSWIDSLGNNESLDLDIHSEGWDEDGTAVTFDVKCFGDYDASSGRYALLSPMLIPNFTAVGGTAGENTDTSPLAKVKVTLWKISLSSSEQNHDKLLDLLEYGIAGATIPVPNSTVASPAKLIPSSDKCQRCSSTLAKCQQDDGCTSLSDYALIPLLSTKAPPLQISVIKDSGGAAAFSADLYSILFSLGSSEYNTPTAWNLVAAEFSCLAYDACDMEYIDVYDKLTNAHPQMDLDIARSSVHVEMRTYIDTEWNIAVNGIIFSFTPIDEPNKVIADTARELQGWLEALNTDTSMQLEVQVVEQIVDVENVTFSIRFFGSFDDDLYQYMLVNPAMIPSFSVVGGTTEDYDGISPAEANVTLPSLTVLSESMKPQYSRLLDMLSDGIASSTPVPTPTSARSMTSSDPCRTCQAATALCRSNTDCLISSQNTLVPLLRDTTMSLSMRPKYESGAARVSLDMSSVLHSLASMTADAFLTREAWDMLANELACFANTACDLEYDDVNSPIWGNHIPTSLSITEVSVFISIRTYVNTEWNMTIGGSTLSYTPPPPSSTTANAAHTDFRDWIETWFSESPRNLLVDKQEPSIDYISNSFTFVMNFSASSTWYGNALAPPWLIPRFQVTGGEAGGGTTDAPAAEANVTLWDVEVVSSGQIPQYNKLLFMLDLYQDW